MRFAVLCAGPTVRGGTKHEPGRKQIPLALGGAVAQQGSLVLVHKDGAVVVAVSETVAVLVRAQDKAQKDSVRVELSLVEQKLSYSEGDGALFCAVSPSTLAEDAHLVVALRPNVHSYVRRIRRGGGTRVAPGT